MGLAISRIYFQDGFPSFDKIQDKFRKQTGLDLYIHGSFKINEIPSSERDAIELLSKDIDKIEKLIDSKTLDNSGEIDDKITQLNHFYPFEFWCMELYSMPFEIKENIIELRFGIKSFYYPSSLEKCLIDLGGVFVDFDDNVVEIDNEKEWNKLKHWDSYNFFNRPKR